MRSFQRTFPVLASQHVATPLSSMPNRNSPTSINEGFFGRFFEVTAEGDVVWEYVNPYFGGPAIQNQVFRAYRYGVDYAGLAGRNLRPGG